MDKRLLVLACGMFAIGTDSFVVAGVLRQVSVSLGVSIALAGRMVTLFALSYGCCRQSSLQQPRTGHASGCC
jgi:predicted MFS family arabinose efflux permease